MYKPFCGRVSISLGQIHTCGIAERHGKCIFNFIRVLVQSGCAIFPTSNAWWILVAPHLCLTLGFCSILKFSHSCDYVVASHGLVYMHWQADSLPLVPPGSLCNPPSTLLMTGPHLRVPSWGCSIAPPVMVARLILKKGDSSLMIVQWKWEIDLRA